MNCNTVDSNDIVNGDETPKDTVLPTEHSDGKVQ